MTSECDSRITEGRSEHVVVGQDRVELARGVRREHLEAGAAEWSPVPLDRLVEVVGDDAKATDGARARARRR